MWSTRQANFLIRLFKQENMLIKKFLTIRSMITKWILKINYLLLSKLFIILICKENYLFFLYNQLPIKLE